MMEPAYGTRSRPLSAAIHDDISCQLYWPEPTSPYDDFALFRGIRNAALLYLVFGLAGVALGWW